MFKNFKRKRALKKAIVAAYDVETVCGLYYYLKNYKRLQKDFIIRTSSLESVGKYIYKMYIIDDIVYV